jgi:hypothetical protein
LKREEGIEKDVAKIIAELVFNRLSANIRECIRIGRLAGNDISKIEQITDTVVRYM